LAKIVYYLFYWFLIFIKYLSIESKVFIF
jgi:hypothetical protein